jgi:NADPH-dependent curcumin reductase CurA
MEGKLKNRETFEMGLENAGKAFVSMTIGKNIG